MMPFFQNQFGNPSSIHRFGRIANKAIEKARKQVAELISANPDEILFTSGGTESNNTAIFGIAHKSPRKHIITSSIEHEAVLEPCRRLHEEGYAITYLPVDRYGLVDVEDLRNSITPETCLVSIMFANNEVGTIQPIKKIAEICKENKLIFPTA